MKMIQDIIVAPIVTESSMEAMQHKKYTFKVMKTANKVEIAKAVEAMFPGTKVAAVNTMNCDGKLKRMGRYQGYTAPRGFSPRCVRTSYCMEPAPAPLKSTKERN